MKMFEEYDGLSFGFGLTVGLLIGFIGMLIMYLHLT